MTTPRLLNPALLKTGLRLEYTTLLWNVVAVVVTAIAALVLNATLHWWWADLVAALVIVFYGFKEGRAAFAEAKHQ